MARTKARLGALAGTLALAAGMTLTNAGPASAAPTFTFSYQSFSNGDYTINVYNNGVLAGSADWYADPPRCLRSRNGRHRGCVGRPGRRLRDRGPSGRDYRIATTAGHASPYTDYVSGDIPEDTPLILRAYVVKGGDVAYSLGKTVYSYGGPGSRSPRVHRSSRSAARTVKADTVRAPSRAKGVLRSVSRPLSDRREGPGPAHDRGAGRQQHAHERVTPAAPVTWIRQVASLDWVADRAMPTRGRLDQTHSGRLTTHRSSGRYRRLGRSPASTSFVVCVTARHPIATMP